MITKMFKLISGLVSTLFGLLMAVASIMIFTLILSTVTKQVTGIDIIDSYIKPFFKGLEKKNDRRRSN